MGKKFPMGRKKIGKCGVGSRYGVGCGKIIKQGEEWLYDGAGNTWHTKCFYREFGHID